MPSDAPLLGGPPHVVLRQAVLDLREGTKEMIRVISVTIEGGGPNYRVFGQSEHDGSLWQWVLVSRGGDFVMGQKRLIATQEQLYRELYRDAT